MASAGASARSCASEHEVHETHRHEAEEDQADQCMLNQAMATRHTTASTSAMNGTSG
jgi:hypothetical protein